MSNFTRLVATVLFSLSALAPGHAGEPWTKDALATTFATILQSQPLTFHNLAEMPTNSTQGADLKQKILADQFKNLGQDESIWGLSAPELIGTITIAGTPENIHTINFVFTASAIKPADLETRLSTHGKFFAALVPDWPAAELWPNTSLHRAWVVSLQQLEADAVPPADHLISEKQGEIYVTTMGIVPKFAIFRLTKKPECNLDPLDPNVFGRWAC